MDTEQLSAFISWMRNTLGWTDAQIVHAITDEVPPLVPPPPSPPPLPTVAHAHTINKLLLFLLCEDDDVSIPAPPPPPTLPSDFSCKPTHAKIKHFFPLKPHAPSSRPTPKDYFTELASRPQQFLDNVSMSLEEFCDIWVDVAPFIEQPRACDVTQLAHALQT